MSSQITQVNRIFSQSQLPMLGLALTVFIASVGWAQDKTDSVDVPAAAVTSGDEPVTTDGDDSPLMPPGEVPSSPVTPEAGASEPGTQEEMPPLEYNEEEKALIAKFEAEHVKLAKEMGDMREIYVKFMNGVDSSRDAESRYREARNSVRKQFNATYDAAIEVIRRAPHDVSVQYIATWIQNREANDIYDPDTFEGAARLIDGGINYMFLFLAGARSAVVSGEFKQAKLLFESMDLEKMEKHDQALFYQLDVLEENWKKEQDAIAADEANGQLPRVLLKTTRGDAVLELFIDSAPQTVANFINLVEEGFYDGLEFYQVIDHLLALTGDPSGNGSGNTGKFLPDEHERVDARLPMRGSLMMAKMPMGETGKFVPNSASCQFAILLLPLGAAKEQTVFGRVVEGMDVISSLRRVDPSKEKKKGAVQVPPDRILTAEMIRRPSELPKIEFVTPGVK